ncbi:MAG: hypothetical protein ABIN61_08240 [candidate division WOR-3 bacterium]
MSEKIKFDIIFLSYDEPFAEEHWKRLKKFYPYAQRVHGIKGILEAHKECARIARTDYFFVVDGDSYILEDFDFTSPTTEKLEEDYFYMWLSRNAVNDLEYANGAVKLFPKRIFDKVEKYGIDVFVHLPHKQIYKVASINRFNSSPFCSWRAGFRECAQLASKHSEKIKDPMRIYLLNVWCNIGIDRPFGKWCIKGARAGRRYGMENIENKEAVEKINDFNWLKERFKYELKEGLLKGMNYSFKQKGGIL